MPADKLFNITGGLPPNPGTGNTSIGESSVAFDTGLKSLKVFDGSTLYTFPSDVSPLTNTTITNIGAKNGSTVTAVEYGNAYFHNTVLTLTALPLTLVNSDGANGLGVKIYDFPEGYITILGAFGSIAETTTSTLSSTLNTGVTYNWAVGTVTQSHAVLITTEQDILSATNGTASATINVAGAASTGVRTVAPTSFNGTATAIDGYFNVGVATDGDIDGNATTTYTGTITILWNFNGDI